MSMTAVRPVDNSRARVPAGAAVERLCAVSVAVLLLRSSFAHLAQPYAFLDTVYSYRLVPAAAGPWVAAVVPFVQLLLAVCLLARWWPRTAYGLALALFLVFSAAQAVTLYRGLDIACGCFGSSEGLKIGWQTLAVAGGCAAACVLGLILIPRESHRCRTAAGRP
jgi:hypothetical protein